MQQAAAHTIPKHDRAASQPPTVMVPNANTRPGWCIQAGCSVVAAPQRPAAATVTAAVADGSPLFVFLVLIPLNVPLGLVVLPVAPLQLVDQDADDGPGGLGAGAGALSRYRVATASRRRPTPGLGTTSGGSGR